MTPAIRNHGETRLKPATLLHENLPQNASLVPREATTFHTSPLVTGLVTVSGNRRAANGENTKRRHGSTQGMGWKLHHVTRKTKTVNRYNNLRETTQNQPDTKNTPPMIPDHLAFSPKLSARAIVVLGGPSNTLSENLSHV